MTTSVTFQRYNSDGNTRMNWEIIEYTGGSGNVARVYPARETRIRLRLAATPGHVGYPRYGEPMPTGSDAVHERCRQSPYGLGSGADAE